MNYLIGIQLPKCKIKMNADRVIETTETGISKIPNPFSIESLMASSTTNQELKDSMLSVNTNRTDMRLHPSYGLPVMPFYNPWMDYLAQAANERLAQLFTTTHDKIPNSATNKELLTNFLSTPTDQRLLVKSNLLDNNYHHGYRDPRLTDLFTAKSDFNQYLSETNQSLQFVNGQEPFRIKCENNPYRNVHRDQIRDDDAMDSDAFSEELSMTMSPDDKTRGK